jgi:Flp pilus assembly pilin Flp
MRPVVQMHPHGRARHLARLCAFDEAGATKIEYSLIVALLSVGIVGAMRTIGSEIVRLLEFVSGRFPN